MDGGLHEPFDVVATSGRTHAGEFERSDYLFEWECLELVNDVDFLGRE